MSHIDENNSIKWDELMKVEINDLDPRHLLKEGDLLFRSRGVTNEVAMVTSPPPSVISVSPLTVIRPISTRVIPAYLAWYLNHSRIQHEISRLAEGTSLLMVSNANLGKLKIVLPPLRIQELILTIYQLSQQEQEIIQEILHKKQAYRDQLLWQIVQGEINIYE